jgi:hypothetical protein
MFDYDDHPEHVICPMVYPLIVDPILVNTRLSEVRMDGGSNLNIIYLKTLDLFGVKRSQLNPSTGASMELCLGKWLCPLAT